MHWRLLTYTDLHEILGFSTDWIRELVRKGKLAKPAYIGPQSPRWDPRDVHAFANANRIQWPDNIPLDPPAGTVRLTARRLARILGVSTQTFYRRSWFQVTPWTHGGRQYWTPEQLLNWWEERRGEGRTAA